VRVPGYTHERVAVIDARPGQIVLVDFASEQGGVIIR